MTEKGIARSGGTSGDKQSGRNERRAAFSVSTRNYMPRRKTRQEIARLGGRAAHIARRCPEPRRQARFAKIARFLLRAARGGRHEH